MIKSLMNLDIELDGSGYAERLEILKSWAYEIIDECASNFRWEWDCDDPHDAVEIVDIDTINDVRKQII